jgi:hypothetical protein
LPAQDFSAAPYSENIGTAPARFVNSCLDFFFPPIALFFAVGVAAAVAVTPVFLVF